MKIRLAIHRDLPSICALYEKFYEYNAELQPNYYLAAIESGGYPKSVIDNGNGDIFVAEEQYDKILGFIHVEEEETPPFASVASHKFAAIIDFYVDPRHRKKGIGKALLEAVKRWAKERALDYLELFVLEENQIGQCFYSRESFESASRTLRYPL